MSWRIADYVCSCGERFESLEAAPTPLSKACPRCGKQAETVISAPMVRVASSGVYAARTGSNDDVPVDEIPEEWR